MSDSVEPIGGRVCGGEPAGSGQLSSLAIVVERYHAIPQLAIFTPNDLARATQHASPAGKTVTVHGEGKQRLNNKRG